MPDPSSPASSADATAFSFSYTEVSELDPGQRWSTWDEIGVTAGPEPWPAWLVTDDAAVDTELGILKTGKEADVFLLERGVEGHPGVVMAAKRYRGEEHRTFHRAASYTEGRRVRNTRDARAMTKKTTFGRSVAAGQWAWSEWQALVRCHELGLPVPYPVQLDEAEMLMEFIGTGRTAAPRLVQVRPAPDLLAELFEQFRHVVLTLAGEGWAHGDLSPYNVLVHDDRIVVIDWPQIVDVVGNPHGFEFLERDVRTMCEWFRRRGLAVDDDLVFGDVAAVAAGSTW